MQLPDPMLHWAEVPETLLALAACDLDDGALPPPRLAAHRGDEPLGLATLRPFPPGGVLDPVVELLALFVPLGADRVCVALPARVWSPDDPLPPVVEDEGIDLRQQAVVIVEADGHGGRCRTRGMVHPLVRHDDGGWGWEAPLAPDETPDAPLLSALTIVLDARDELDADRWEPRAQLERVLGLGHGLALGPAAVGQLPSPPALRTVGGAR